MIPGGVARAACVSRPSDGGASSLVAFILRGRFHMVFRRRCLRASHAEGHKFSHALRDAVKRDLVSRGSAEAIQRWGGSGPQDFDPSDERGDPTPLPMALARLRDGSEGVFCVSGKRRHASAPGGLRFGVSSTSSCPQRLKMMTSAPRWISLVVFRALRLFLQLARGFRMV